MMPRFSQDLFDTICERIADGESLRSICRDKDMPTTAAVMKWLVKDDNGKLVEQYTRAREFQADALFDETLDIADDARNDWMDRNGEESTGWQLNGEHIQRSKVRIDARKWMAGKLRPKKYGDKQVVEHSGVDGGAIRVEVNELSDEQLAVIAAGGSAATSSEA